MKCLQSFRILKVNYQKYVILKNHPLQECKNIIIIIIVIIALFNSNKLKKFLIKISWIININKVNKNQIYIKINQRFSNQLWLIRLLIMLIIVRKILQQIQMNTILWNVCSIFYQKLIDWSYFNLVLFKISIIKIEKKIVNFMKNLFNMNKF